MRREIKVGIFLTLALIILAIFIFVVGNLSNLFRRPGYPLIVRYETSLGLDKTAAVKMAGIKIGYVKNIELENRRSKVTLSIYPKYKVPRGSTASQAVQGLLGEKYVDIAPGTSPDNLNPGDELQAGVSSGLDQLTPMLTGLGKDFQQVAKSLQDMMNEQTRQDFSEALKNIAGLTGELQSFLADNRQKLNRTIDAASNTAKDLDVQVDALSKSIGDTLEELRGILQENRADIRDNLGRIKELLGKMEESIRLLNNSLEKIDKGEGTVGRLVNDESLYEEARNAVHGVQKISGTVSALSLHGDLRGEYLGRTDFFKGVFSLSLWHGGRYFFLGQVVGLPAAAGSPDSGHLAYSAQGGIRWGGFAPRAGIIESQFGAGVDYYALGDRLVLSLEGLDFNRATSPLVRTFARFYPQKNVYVIVGLEDFTLAAKREVFFGLGVGL